MRMVRIAFYCSLIPWVLIGLMMLIPNKHNPAMSIFITLPALYLLDSPIGDFLTQFVSYDVVAYTSMAIFYFLIFLTPMLIIKGLVALGLKLTGETLDEKPRDVS